jgi:hypothetical protein
MESLNQLYPQIFSFLLRDHIAVVTAGRINENKPIIANEKSSPTLIDDLLQGKGLLTIRYMLFASAGAKKI